MKVLKEEMLSALDDVTKAKTLEEAQQAAWEILEKRRRPTRYKEKVCTVCGVIFNDRKGLTCSDRCNTKYLQKRLYEQRRVWELREGGMQWKEIAGELGLSASQAQQRWQRFIRKMRHPSRREEAKKLGLKFE